MTQIARILILRKTEARSLPPSCVLRNHMDTTRRDDCSILAVCSASRNFETSLSDSRQAM